MAGCQRRELLHAPIVEGTGTEEDRTNMLLRKCCEGHFEIAIGSGVHNNELQTQQRLSQRRDASLPHGIVFVTPRKHADAPHAVALLRLRDHRPHRRAPETRNELPPSHQPCLRASRCSSTSLSRARWLIKIMK
jgi:hypothetical protein